ncbi:flagellar export chaperone FlgN [Thermanaerovibrio acidaminovorans]|uniref:flagellar export chaperone FlgN n=1 Tax=Thermanaerovibrio acidaminovorans TaxID=81462 RepID=UPI001F5F104F|nr:flagellar export chaperone FlgN [Thermanaerovibrio acidaminovorans]
MLTLRADPDALKSRVEGLIDQEMAIYSALGGLIDREAQCVSDRDMEGLMEVLKEKQSYISRQEELLDLWREVAVSLGVSGGRESSAFWAAISSKVGERGFNDLVLKVNQVRQMAASLLDREREVQGELESHLSELRAKLIQMRNGRQVIRGYGG